VNQYGRVHELEKGMKEMKLQMNPSSFVCSCQVNSVVHIVFSYPLGSNLQYPSTDRTGGVRGEGGTSEARGGI